MLLRLFHVSYMALCFAALVGQAIAEDISRPGDTTCTLDKLINKDLVLKMHNEAREKEGGQSKGILPLLWSEKLACSAQAWANKCIFEHSTSGYAENIGANTVPETINAWYSEWKDYKYGAVATETTGHYFNMAWKDGKWVGCGAKVCTSTQLGLDTLNNPGQIVVCQYLDNGHFESDSSKEVWRPNDSSPLSVPSLSSSSSSSGSKQHPSISHSKSNTSSPSEAAPQDATDECEESRKVSKDFARLQRRQRKLHH